MIKKQAFFNKTFLAISGLLFCTASLNGCANNSDKPRITYGSLYNNLTTGSYNYTTIDADEYISKNAGEQTYLLFVLGAAGTTCTCFGKLANEVIKPFVNDFDIPVFVMEYAIATSINDNSKHGLSPEQSYLTSYIIIKGDAKHKRSEKNKDPIFELNGNAAYEAYKTYVFDQVRVPLTYLINYKNLQDIINTGENQFIVYFARGTCIDCASVDALVFKDFDVKNPKIRIYKIDSDELRDPPNYTKWNEFKEDYGLTASGNAKFGYGVGYVPTFQYIDTSEGRNVNDYVIDAAVFLNDAKVLDDNTDTYTITDSFYTTQRLEVLGDWAKDVTPNALVGVEVPMAMFADPKASDSFAAKYHVPLLKAFLNYYI